ncbi:MAG TPA: LETM1-related biofilm-associated protein [Flavobacterium sp.]|uniref:LETM1-related biofilm-associated protein n=1 Tax=Flavobacterium sp. TaxID=239 RepID=UPI002B4B7C38|nr:LETM1-related biofilm-associated protein [Flavobacterium sp.]HLO73081.1 LETM1-related biofilm-associated protein [Flavobacterium sp.]
MINPSTNGWIDKFFTENRDNFIDFQGNYLSFYESCRKTGFIYGYVVNFQLKENLNTTKWSYDEITKVGFLNTLFSVYSLEKEKVNSKDFIESVYEFYKIIQPENLNFIKKMLPEGSRSSRLEKVIDNRIQTNQNSISKNFSHIITNALLFIDVLAFHYYLKNNELASDYLKNVESDCIKIVSLALKIKPNKSKYDELLVKLFENSIRYTKFSTINSIEFSDIKLLKYDELLEKLYLLDIAQMALWSDEKLEKEENDFLKKINTNLGLDALILEKSINEVNFFINQYKAEIPFFNYSNPIKHFYDQANKNVTKLIIRNKDRLTKEIKESGELMQLLAKSTRKDLSKDEKKKVKKQLLDICKTVPSLTIFLLPGGGLLLPILIKFIPQLLPSAFNENLED